MRLHALLLFMTTACLFGCAALRMGGPAPAEQWTFEIHEYRQVDFTVTADLARTEVTDDSCLLDGSGHFSFNHFKHGIVTGTMRIKGRVQDGIARLDALCEFSSSGYGSGSREFILEGTMGASRGFGHWRYPNTSNQGAWSARLAAGDKPAQGGL